MYDCVIVGMGAAGMSAALYAHNANMNVLILDSVCPGGVLNKVKSINNFIGFGGFSGQDLALSMFNHIRRENINYKIAKVLKIDKINDGFNIITSNGEFSSKGVILACGRKLNKENIINEDKFLGKGISYCSICDGNLYKDKSVIVIGNDDYAYNDALYLNSICSSVVIVTNKKEVTFNNKDNIKVMDDEVLSFSGNEVLESVKLSSGEIKCDGVFISNGGGCDNGFINSLGITDDKGYVIVDHNMKTSIDNMYACGDVIKKEIYQVCTSVSEGCIALINLKKSIKE